jgi:hypothetical protein
MARYYPSDLASVEMLVTRAALRLWLVRLSLTGTVWSEPLSVFCTGFSGRSGPKC